MTAEMLSSKLRAPTDVLAADGNPLAVGLVGDAIDLLQVVGVGDDLVTGDEVLGRGSAESVR